MAQPRPLGAGVVGTVSIPLVHRVAIDDIQRGHHIYHYPGRPSRMSAIHGIYVGERDCEVIFLHRNEVIIITLEEFLPLTANGQLPQVHLYRYGVCDVEERLKSPFLSMVSRRPSKPPEDVIEVAKWFARHRHAFSNNWPGELHSEQFALFCQTTRYLVDDLRMAHSFQPSRLPVIFEEHFRGAAAVRQDAHSWQSSQALELTGTVCRKTPTLVVTHTEHFGQDCDHRYHLHQSRPLPVSAHEQHSSGRSLDHSHLSHGHTLRTSHSNRQPGPPPPFMPAPPLPDSTHKPSSHPPSLPHHQHARQSLQSTQHPSQNFFEESRPDTSLQRLSKLSPPLDSLGRPDQKLARTFNSTSTGSLHGPRLKPQIDGGNSARARVSYIQVSHSLKENTFKKQSGVARQPVQTEIGAACRSKPPFTSQDFSQEVQGYTCAEGVRERARKLKAPAQSSTQIYLNQAISVTDSLGKHTHQQHKAKQRWPTVEEYPESSEAHCFQRVPDAQPRRVSSSAVLVKDINVSSLRQHSLPEQHLSSSPQLERIPNSPQYYHCSDQRVRNLTMPVCSHHQSPAHYINNSSCSAMASTGERVSNSFTYPEPLQQLHDPSDYHDAQTHFFPAENERNNPILQHTSADSFPPPPPLPPHAPPPPPKCSLPAPPLHPRSNFMAQPRPLNQPPPPACPPPSMLPHSTAGWEQHQDGFDIAEEQVHKQPSQVGLAPPPPPLPLVSNPPTAPKPSAPKPWHPLHQQLESASKSLHQTSTTKPIWQSPVKAVVGGLIGGVVGGATGALLAAGGQGGKQQEPIEQERSIIN